MTEFTRKPPKVYAVHWDGSLDGAKDVRAFLGKHRPTCSGIKMVTNLMSDGAEVVTLSFREELGVDGYLRPNMWLVYVYSEGFETMTDQWFQENFEEKDEDDAGPELHSA